MKRSLGLVHVVPRSVAASTSCIPCVAGGGTGANYNVAIYGVKIVP
jgi:hypothetical protein